MGQIIFIMWRESVEALLVVGILYAWLSRTPDAAGGGRTSPAHPSERRTGVSFRF